MRGIGRTSRGPPRQAGRLVVRAIDLRHSLPMPGVPESAMKGRWSFALLGFGIGVLLAVVARLTWQGPPSERQTSDPGRAVTQGPPGASTRQDASKPRQEDLERLREALAAEREARTLLEAELVSLREELARLRDPARPVEEPERDARRRSFDEEALLGIGIGEREARRLHERFEEFERQRLDILDEETGEDGVLSRAGLAKLFVAEQKLKYELGEEAYDAILYATGRDNRLVVRLVVDDSPAQQVGIEPGDVLLRYGDERLFAPLDLQQATRTQGGDSVEVELLRGEERMRVFVPGGWLGVTVGAARHEP